MSRLHEKFPEHDIFMSEGSEYGVGGAAKIIEFFRNWARSYMAWVTMLDNDRQPNSGPFYANPTMLELDKATGAVHRNFEYFMYGQFSKFVRRGAVRVDTSAHSADFGAPRTELLSHVGFVNGLNSRGHGNDGAVVVVLVNEARWPRTLELELACGPIVGSRASGPVVIPARSISTFRWQQSCQ